jgi:hypothetical protein
MYPDGAQVVGEAWLEESPGRNIERLSGTEILYQVIRVSTGCCRAAFFFALNRGLFCATWAAAATRAARFALYRQPANLQKVSPRKTAMLYPSPVFSIGLRLKVWM